VDPTFLLHPGRLQGRDVEQLVRFRDPLRPVESRIDDQQEAARGLLKAMALPAQLPNLPGLLGSLKGEVAMQCGRGRMEDAVATARWYSELFPERYYIELQENTIPEQDIVNKRLMEVAAELKLPLVATNDCHYLNREDARAHEVLLCIQTGKTMDDPSRMRFGS